MLSVQDTSSTSELETSSPSTLSKNPAVIYLMSLSPGSTRTMKQALDTIADIASSGQCNAYTFPWHQLTYSHTTGIRTALASRYAAATANKMLAAMKQVLKECRRLGTIDVGVYAQAVDLKPVKGNSLPKGRMLDSDEIKVLREFLEADNTLVGRRNLAMFWALRVGLRRSEVVALNEEDFNYKEGSVIVRAGKGNKRRKVHLPDKGADAINDWLNAKGYTSPALFVAISKTGRVLSRRLSDQAVLFIMKEKAKVVAVTNFSPHDFRRTFISELLDGGADIVTAQQLAGHSSVETTSRYDRRGDAAKKKAVNLLV